MEGTIASYFTAPEFSLGAIFTLRYKVACEAELKREVTTFLETYENSKRVIAADQQKMREAALHFVLQNFDKALALLSDATRTDAKLLRARSEFACYQKETAIKTLNSFADKLASLDQEMLQQVALLACDLGQVEMAEKAVAGFVQNETRSGEVIFLQAYLAEVQNALQKALDGYLEAACSSHSLKALNIFRLARLQDMRGLDDEALANYRRIDAEGYTFEEALINLGVLFEDRQEYSAALRCYEKALKINSQNARARLYHSDAQAGLDMHYDERKLKQDIKTSEILSIPISDLELSVRSRNCLSKMGIHSLKDLITKTEQELLSYKNFGETSLKEIRAMLSKKGLHLGMTRVEEQPLADRIKMNAQLYSLDRDFSLDQLDISIEELDLSYRTKSSLHKLNFESLRDITMRTRTDLENNSLISPASLQEINALLEERGLSYRPETTMSGREDGSSLLGDDDDGVNEVSVYDGELTTVVNPDNESSYDEE